ncbi:MAG: uracil-DNA glycosylase [Rubellimicrobium sp.]|nr:uracil-DNA glycosylase [Rubellimicrobium sp.]
MESSLTYEAALAALAWQVELGVSDAIGDSPIDRHTLGAAAAAARPAPVAAPPPRAASPTLASPPTPAADQVAAVARARAAAEGAGTLGALASAMEQAPSDLRLGARHFVFADGNPQARLMIVGEAPGRDEDLEGRPFVGKAGQLLDRMLAAIGLARDHPDPAQSVYITNVLPWRPPGNRTPDPAEIAEFLPFLERHIALAAPDALLLMGNTPCQALFGQAGITRIRGAWRQVQGIPALATFHPAYLLRTPAAKREAWADLLALRARLSEGAAKAGGGR